MSKYGIKLDLEKLRNKTDEFEAPLTKNNVLIICIDNFSFDKMTMSYIKKMPNIILNAMMYKKYNDIYVIKSYPNLDIINVQDLYANFNSLSVDKNNQNIDKIIKNERRIDLLNMCNDFVDNINKANNISLILATKYLYSGESYDNKLSKLASVANMCYIYTYNSIWAETNNINTYQIDLNNTDTGDRIIFNHLVKNNSQVTVSTLNCSLKYEQYNYKLYGILNIDNNDYTINIKENDKMMTFNKNNIKYVNLINGDINDDVLMLYNIMLDNLINSDNFDVDIDFKNIIKHMYETNNKNDTMRCKINELMKKYRMLNNKITNKKIKTINEEETNDKTEMIQTLNQFVKVSNINIKNKNILDKVNNTIMTNYNKTNNEVVNLLNTIYEENKMYELEDVDSDDTRVDDSNDFFISMITLSNWIDELKNGNSMGMLLNVKSNELTKIGANGITPTITNITTTFIPIKDYIETVLMIFRIEKKDDVRNITGLHGDIREIIGKGNSVIPLYICNQHWKLARIHLEYVLGIIIVNNPYGYIDSHLNFMFYILTEMTRKLISNFNNKDVKTYIAMFRTCAELAYEKGYHKGIKKMIANLIKDDKSILMRPFGFSVVFGQILSTGSSIDDESLMNLCDKTYQNIFEYNYKKYYDERYKKEIIIPIINDPEKHELLNIELKEINKFIDNKIVNEIDVIMSNYRMIKIFKMIIKENKGFIKFLNKIDYYYSNLDEENVILFTKLLKNNGKHNSSSEELYKTINMNHEEKVREYVLKCINNT